MPIVALVGTLSLPGGVVLWRWRQPRGRFDRRMRSRPFVAAVVLTLLFACVETRGQDRPLFSANAELVVLHVTVTDKKGTYVSGLSREAFAVFENGQPQPIELFTNQDAPATIGVLIDGSGSMQPHRELMIAAATAFAEASHPQDELFALRFNETVRSALPDDAPFTNDAGVLRAALTGSISARGRTALYDTISAGLNYLGRGRQERKVLVIVSDGGDNASATTFQDLLTKIRTSNALIYIVALVDAVYSDANPKVLRQIAQATGGDMFLPTDTRQMIQVLTQIARDIRNSYTIGYMPATMPPDGAFHRLRVIVQSPDRRSLVVRTRTGYLAGSMKAK